MDTPQFSGWAQTWRHDGNTQKRFRAIRSFAKDMKSPHDFKWSKRWADARGTSGMLHLLSLASVREVKAVCMAIRNSNRRAGLNPGRERAVEELVKALLPQHYPSTDLRTNDKRPLHKYYGRMLRACSSSFVEQVLDAQDDSNPLYQELNLRKMCITHGKMLRARLTKHLTQAGPQIPQHELDVTFSEFVFREPRLPGHLEHMSASMQYAFEMLKARLVGECTAARWPRSLTEMQVFMSVYSRYKRSSRTANKVPLIEFGFELIELEPAFKSTEGATTLMSEAAALWKKDPRKQHEDILSRGLRLGLRGHILPEIAMRWKDDPDRFENLLVQALSLGHGGSPKMIGDSYWKLIDAEPFREISSELRWRLLCLYCKHIPEEGVDIAITSADYINLANQDWPFEVVDKLDREHAILFLKCLYSVNPSVDFLRAPRYKSIYALRNLSSQRNFNVTLLLTAYQQEDVDTQQKAREQVDRLRKSAAASREQDDRALFAKAAAHLAIATGDLDIYAETLMWHRRFIRDSLTVRSLFAQDTIATSEGIGLLSGIILPVVEGTTLSVIEQRLAAANQILKGLNETALMAKKEPSNNHRTWVALESLYTAIYRERVSRANKINLEARESEFDMFHTIWSGTADLAHHIGSDFMKQVEGPILDLLSGLSGCSLVAASNTLLDFASEWTRKGDRNADHDKITATMEKLSYQAVSRLAYSDTPALAQDLIQRAIIEFPAASSWHRQFLSLRYMKDLPARDAKTMLLSFASAIGEKLEEQSYVKIGEAELPKGAPPASVVKVSTVKYLAQLLNNSEFIAPEPAIEVLIELFKGGTHIDIRIATLDSLLSTLNTILNETAEEWSSNPTIRKIINTLEIIIPIAGNINERRPVSDSDWAEAEENTEVPCTSSDEFTIPPLLGAILNIVKGEKYPNLKYLKWELFVRLVLPILKLSQEQHHTWFSLFLAKHGTTLDADRLPAIPITPLVWYQLLDYHSDLVPSVVIDQYNQYALLLLRMPKDIQEFNEALQRDTTLRNDPNVNHWLSIFCETGTLDFFGRNMRYRLLELIFSPHRAVAEKTDLLDVVVSQASALLDDYERRADEWHHLVANLKPRRTWQPADDYDSAHSKENWTSWHDWSNTLSLRLITLLEGKTVSEEGFALPSTFPLRLWGVPYPEPRAIEHDSNANFHLATHLDSTLSSFLESREGDALLWATLAEDVYNTLHVVYLTGLEPAEISTVVRLRIAIHVGDLNVDGQSVAPAVQLIKVAVTLKFVDSITKPTIPQKPKTQELPPDQVLTGDLIKRLHAVMNSWMQGGAKGSGVSAGVRNMAVKWKSENQAVWKNICSWDST